MNEHIQPRNASHDIDERTAVYIGALLHDIGKFTERAKQESRQKKARKYIDDNLTDASYAHRRYSADVIETCVPSWKAAMHYALFHHRGKTKDKTDFDILQKDVVLKLVRIADDCSSAERVQNKELQPVQYFKARLLSPFSEIVMHPHTIGSKQYLDVEVLSIDKKAQFIAEKNGEKAESEENAYEKYSPNIVERFEHDLKRNPDAVFGLLQKFCSSVPAQTPVEFNGQECLNMPDVNLFDHSRLTAGIALALYDEYKQGSWKGQETSILSTEKTSDGQPLYSTLPAPCILIGGDMSGIQDFIFNITTDDRIARSLKGRSFFVQILAEVCIKLICDALDLQEASVLFNGGGNFSILAAKTHAEHLPQLRKRIAQALKSCGLYCVLDYVEVGIADFKDFSPVRDRLHEKLAARKHEKFRELSFDEIFHAFPQSVRSWQFDDWADDLVSSRGYAIIPDNHSRRITAMDSHRAVFNALGYRVEFFDTIPSDAPQPGEIRTYFNDTTLSSGIHRFRFAVKDLPQSGHGIKGFDLIAKESKRRTGTEKLAVLKMDVDNLGRIFREGLPKELRTISRVASISRALQWFFEGYMNTLLEEEFDEEFGSVRSKFADNIYPIFSGGDDLFFVGAWDAMFEFAGHLETAFKQYTGGNQSVNISAGLIVVPPKFPVVRFAELAEEALWQSKSYMVHHETQPTKNKVTVFGYSLTWSEYREAQKIKKLLVKLISELDVSRSVIQKLTKAIQHFEITYKRMQKTGRFKTYPMWRFAYQLRDVRKIADPKNPKQQEQEKKQIADMLIKRYEDIVVDAVMSNKTQIGILAVAARWAEFATRLESNRNKE